MRFVWEWTRLRVVLAFSRWLAASVSPWMLRVGATRVPVLVAIGAGIVGGGVVAWLVGAL